MENVNFVHQINIYIGETIMGKPLIGLHKEIIKQYNNNGFISIYVFGQEGSGKTSYALWLGYLIYRDWKKVLRHLYLEPVPLMMDMLRALEKKQRLLYVIADDPGRWLNKHDWFTENVRSFSRFYNIIRTTVAGIIFTSPADDIIKDIRKKAHYRGKAYRLSRYMGSTSKPKPVKIILTNKDYLKNFYGIDIESEEYSIVNHYNMDVNMMFKEYPKLAGFEIYPTYYPDWVHEEYMEMRRKATIGDLRKLVNKWLNGGDGDGLSNLFSERELRAITVYTLRKYGYSFHKIGKILNISVTQVRKDYRYIKEYIADLKANMKKTYI